MSERRSITLSIDTVDMHWLVEEADVQGIGVQKLIKRIIDSFIATHPMPGIIELPERAPAIASLCRGPRMSPLPPKLHTPRAHDH